MYATERTLVALLLCTGVQLCLAGPNEAGLKFLEENKDKEGVITLPSGLQYKVLHEGDGDSHPTIDSTCSCHYKGTLIDGTQFDSSYDRNAPTDFAPNQVIRGWTEAMQLMVEGDKWEMYIPSDLGYGDRGSPPKIGPGDTLIFQMELLKIKGSKVPADKCDVVSLAKCSEKEVKYIAKQKAKGLAAEKLGEEIQRLEKMFDSKMEESLLAWVKKRVSLLRKLVVAVEQKDEL